MGPLPEPIMPEFESANLTHWEAKIATCIIFSEKSGGTQMAWV